MSGAYWLSAPRELDPDYPFEGCICMYVKQGYRKRGNGSIDWDQVIALVKQHGPERIVVTYIEDMREQIFDNASFPDVRDAVLVTLKVKQSASAPGK